MAQDLYLIGRFKRTPSWQEASAKQTTGRGLIHLGQLGTRYFLGISAPAVY